MTPPPRSPLVQASSASGRSAPPMALVPRGTNTNCCSRGRQDAALDFGPSKRSEFHPAVTMGLLRSLRVIAVIVRPLALAPARP
jgi:hypothetical protein